MRNSQYARSYGAKAVRRGFGHFRGNKDRQNELGASLVEYALILSLVGVVAIGALVYLGSSVSHTVNAVATAVTPDPPSVLTSVTPGSGVSCGVMADGTTLTGFCGGQYQWLDGKQIYSSGQWLLIVNSNTPGPGQINDRTAYRDATLTPPVAWTCLVASGAVCTTIATPSSVVPFAIQA